MTADTPLYRVTAPTYLGGGYYNPENQPENGLTWDGEPNAALEPLNAAAEKRVKAYEADRERREARAESSVSGSVKTAGKEVAHLERERDAAVDRAVRAEARIDELLDENGTLKTENAKLSAQVAKFDHDGDGNVGGAREGQNPNPTVDVVNPTPALADGQEALAPAPQTVDDLADARTEPGDSPAKLEKIEREVDDANGKKPKADAKPKRSPEEEKDRKEAIAILREKKVKFFAGASTDDLVRQASEA